MKSCDRSTQSSDDSCNESGRAFPGSPFPPLPAGEQTFSPGVDRLAMKSHITQTCTALRCPGCKRFYQFFPHHVMMDRIKFYKNACFCFPNVPEQLCIMRESRPYTDLLSCNPGKLTPIIGSVKTDTPAGPLPTAPFVSRKKDRTVSAPATIPAAACRGASF